MGEKLAVPEAGAPAIWRHLWRMQPACGCRTPRRKPTFELTRPGKNLGIGNADVDRVEDCKTNTPRAYQGRGLVNFQTTATPGEISLKATTPGLEPRVSRCKAGRAGRSEQGAP